MESIVRNISLGRVRRETVNDRPFLVAPVSMIKEGVLNGSKGKLFYPRDEMFRNHDAWNGMPAVVYHPVDPLTGKPVSARSPHVMAKEEIGRVYNTAEKGNKLAAEVWLDEELTRKLAPSVLTRLNAGQAVEVSTGLYTDNVKAPEGANHEGVPYDYVARNYRPDHLAILPDQRGACSVDDGCGLLMNGREVVTDNSNPEGINQYTKGEAVAGPHPHTNRGKKAVEEVEDKLTSSLVKKGYGRHFVGSEGDHFHVFRAANVSTSGTIKLATLGHKNAHIDDLKSALSAHVKRMDQVNNLSTPQEDAMPDPALNASSSMVKEAGVMSDAAYGATAAARETDSPDDHVDAAKAHLDASKKHKEAAGQVVGGEAEKCKAQASMHAKMANEHMGMAQKPVYNTGTVKDTEQPEEDHMDRNAVINYLTTNCDCWKGDGDASLLAKFSDDKLTALKRQAIAVNETKPVVETPEYVGNSARQAPAASSSKDEWMRNAPPEIRAAVNNSLKIVNEKKSRLVDRLVANVSPERRESHINLLMRKDVEELEMDLERLPVSNGESGTHGDYIPLPSYFGAAGGPATNGRSQMIDEEPALELPTINWAENPYEAKTKAS